VRNGKEKENKKIELKEKKDGTEGRKKTGREGEERNKEGETNQLGSLHY
jgi:hypothetical protein